MYDDLDLIAANLCIEVVRCEHVGHIRDLVHLTGLATGDTGSGAVNLGRGPADPVDDLVAKQPQEQRFQPARSG